MTHGTGIGVRVRGMSPTSFETSVRVRDVGAEYDVVEEAVVRWKGVMLLVRVELQLGTDALEDGAEECTSGSAFCAVEYEDASGCRSTTGQIQNSSTITSDWNWLVCDKRCAPIPQPNAGADVPIHTAPKTLDRMRTIQEPLRAIPAGIDYLLTPTRPSRILQPGDESGRQWNRLLRELD